MYIKVLFCSLLFRSSDREFFFFYFYWKIFIGNVKTMLLNSMKRFSLGSKNTKERHSFYIVSYCFILTVGVVSVNLYVMSVHVSIYATLYGVSNQRNKNVVMVNWQKQGEENRRDKRTIRRWQNQKNKRILKEKFDYRNCQTKWF